MMRVYVCMRVHACVRVCVCVCVHMHRSHPVMLYASLRSPPHRPRPQQAVPTHAAWRCQSCQRTPRVLARAPPALASTRPTLTRFRVAPASHRSIAVYDALMPDQIHGHNDYVGITQSTDGVQWSPAQYVPRRAAAPALLGMMGAAPNGCVGLAAPFPTPCVGPHVGPRWVRPMAQPHNLARLLCQMIWQHEGKGEGGGGYHLLCQRIRQHGGGTAWVKPKCRRK